MLVCWPNQKIYRVCSYLYFVRHRGPDGLTLDSAYGSTIHGAIFDWWPTKDSWFWCRNSMELWWVKKLRAVKFMEVDWIMSFLCLILTGITVIWCKTVFVKGRTWCCRPNQKIYRGRQSMKLFSFCQAQKPGWLYGLELDCIFN